MAGGARRRGSGEEMAKWNVSAKVVGSKFLGTFEAKTKNEAIAKAERSNGGVNLCHQCADECEDAELTDFYADKEAE